MSEDSIFDLPQVSWDTPATATTIADIRSIAVKDKPRIRRSVIVTPQEVAGQMAYYFPEDPEIAYLRLRDAVWLIQAAGASRAQAAEAGDVRCYFPGYPETVYASAYDVARLIRRIKAASGTADSHE